MKTGETMRDLLLAMRGPRLELHSGDPVEVYDRGTGATEWLGKVYGLRPKSNRVLVVRDGGKAKYCFSVYGDAISVGWYVPERWRLRRVS